MTINLFSEEPVTQVERTAQTFAELCSLLESEDFAGEFYIAANTVEWLHDWMSADERLAVRALEEKVLTDFNLARQLADRALGFFNSPCHPGYRIEHEAVLCCYAFILCRVPEAEVRSAIREMDGKAGRSHGWLRRVLRRCLRRDSVNVRLLEASMPPKARLASAQSTTDFNRSDPLSVEFLSDTSFDYISESWTLQEAA